MRKKSLQNYVLGELIVLAMFIYSYFIAAESFGMMKSWMITMMMVCIPLCVSVYNIKDKKILYDYLLKFSWSILVVLIVNAMGSKNNLYDMHFSYTILLLILLHANEAINRKSIKFFFVALFEFFMMMFFGSRGAIFCTIIFIGLKLFFVDETKNLKKRITSSVIIISIIGVIYILFSINILKIVYILKKYNINSRTINMITNGVFISHDSGRKLIWEYSKQLIKKKPILGWGIGGASSHLRSFYNGVSYPHNIFYDLWLSFGCILGSLIIGWIIFSLRKLFIVKEKNERQLIIIFFSISSCLIFSATLFTNYYFFILLGLLLSVKVNKIKS